LAGQEDRLAALIMAQPDMTLEELRDALPTTAALSTLWLEIDRLGFSLKNGTARAARYLLDQKLRHRYAPTTREEWPRTF
jgi:hypothetical protein